MQVDVYRNLQTGTYSVRDRATGRVVDRPDTVVVADARFVVQPAGQARVRATGRKGVHAFVRGTLPDGPPDAAAAARLGTRVTYCPHRYDTFVEAETGLPVHQAEEVALLPDGRVYAVGLLTDLPAYAAR